MWGDKTFLFTAYTGSAASLFGGVAIGVISNHDVLVAGPGSNWEAASVVGVEPAEGHNGYNNKV
jgi:hypothetical protein